MNIKYFPLLIAVSLGITACGQTSGTGTSATEQEVVETYAELVYLSYADARDHAVALRDAIDAFVADPTPGKLEAAKRAWLEARIPYGQTEPYRFYGGPIDDADGPEGQLNAWPLDEVYIDYVDGAPDAGIVNDTTIEITKERLAALNEGGEGDVTGLGDAFDEDKAISTGYHAIEFLLWGQDFEDGGPGSRPYTDFVTGAEATAPNGDRRGLFLTTVADLLVDDLDGLVAAWAPGSDGYRATFTAQDPRDALTLMLTGAGVLSKGELAAERMDVALQTLDQEDEHSCFSDNTHVDFLMNATGIQNVWLGRYEYFDGPSIRDLVRQVDPALADEMDTLAIAAIESIKAIPSPFDQAIGENGSDGWNKANAAVQALFDLGDEIIDVGLALGLDNVSVDLPE